MSNRQQRRQRRYLVERDDQGVTHVMSSEGFGQVLDGTSLQRRYQGPDLDSIPAGQHLWVMAVCYGVDPTKEGQHTLDLENLVQVGGIGCFICEQPYTKALYVTPCPGEP